MKRNHFGPWLICMALLCLVGACATPESRGVGSPAEARAENLATSGRHAEAAALYIDLATRTAGSARDRLTLLAAEQWLNAGDGRRAASALSSVPRPPEGEMLWLWTSNTAALALWQGQPDDALRLLEPLNRQPLPQRHRLNVEALRADAWFQKDDPARAVGLYLQREARLDISSQIESNRQRLWDGILVSNAQTLRRAAETASDPEVRGWLALGALATATGQQGIGWSNGLARWQADFGDHPAQSILSELRQPDSGVLDYPRQIALLLPLSGQNAAAGRAIQNGFLGAYFSASAHLTALPQTSDGGAGDIEYMSGTTFDAGRSQQRIRVYDVNVSGAPESYAQAVADGAEFVVGPLLRPGVTALAAEPVLPVPVLTLNYLPDNTEAPPGFYQFALAPEDEAAAAAAKAVADGHSRALALVPNNEWGRRVLSSFATRFENSGGILLDHRNYQPSSQDFSFEIESLMALTQSVQRYQRLRANIGAPLQFDPRRRQDAQFIFLAADSRSGRLIKSQLKYHYAGDLPVYSTSFIYSMDGRSDADLNGVMIADTPWIVSPKASFADLPAIYNRYWPAERRLGRLHAMGFDAYRLVAELHSAHSGPMREFDGATGRLYLDEDGRVHRRLAWAQFVAGRLVALPEPAWPGRSLEDLNGNGTREWRPPQRDQ